MFSVVHYTQTSVNDFNKDLEIKNNWSYQWKMNFNPDPTKQVQEVIFNGKAQEIYHPQLVLIVGTLPFLLEKGLNVLPNFQNGGGGLRETLIFRGESVGKRGGENLKYLMTKKVFLS